MATIPALKDVETIIAVHSAKGGVGKSTVTVNLAVALAKKGAKVGLLDADVHGPSGALMMGTGEWPSPGPVENSILPLNAHGIKFISIANMTTNETPLIWRGPMVTNVINQLLGNVYWGKLDYLFIDMPPGTGDAQLTISQTVPITGVIAVSTPQELSLEDSMRGIRSFAKVNVPVLGLIENMSWFICDDCEEKSFPFGDSGAKVMAEEMGVPLLGRLPLEPLVCKGGDTGKPFALAFPNSASSRALDVILANLATQLEGKKPAPAYLDVQWKPMEWHERNPTAPDLKGPFDGPVAALWQVSFDELGVLWSDGRTNILAVRKMRLACPCAACVDEWTGEALLDPNSVATDLSLKDIRAIGRYAVLPTFSDGHKSGIFHFDRLASLIEE